MLTQYIIRLMLPGAGGAPAECRRDAGGKPRHDEGVRTVQPLLGRIRPGPTRPSTPRWLALTVAATTLVAVGAYVVTSAAPASAAASPGCGKAPTLTSGNRTIQSGGK